MAKGTVEFYCLAEKKHVKATPTSEKDLKGGRRVLQSTCPDCGRKVARIASSKN